MSRPTPPPLLGANLQPRPIRPKEESRDSSATPSLESNQDSGAAVKRRCISSACMPCRKRKSKCDGNRPTCNSCLTVYSTPCYYDIDSDHRRKGALKRDIAQLKEEAGTLETIVEALKKSSEAQVDDIIQLMRTHPDESYEWLANGIKNLASVSAKNGVTALEGDLEDDVLQPTLDRTGETRNYGHTSNLTMIGLDDELPIPSTEFFETWTTVTKDKDLVKHLLSLYFAWAHPFYLLFSEEVFFHSLNSKKVKYCTPLLVNSILAVACNFSDRPEARADPNNPSTVGDHFFAEAKRLFSEIDRPSLTTVQALGIMAMRQAMNGDDNDGWLYVWQMMAMSVQLGLHISYTPNVGCQISPAEIEARRVTFWGCHVIETSFSLCVGRVSSFTRYAIQLERPIIRENLESKIWKPYGDPRFPHGTAELEQPSFTYTILLHYSLLTEIVNDIVFWFYAPRDRRTSRKLLAFYERFKTWHRNLPDCLAIKDGKPTLPQVITLHMYYHTCILHLFRPFILQSFVQSPSKPPRQICTEAAMTISQLVVCYRNTYGLRRSYFMISHCAITAAIIHIRNITCPKPNPIADQSLINLVDAIKAIYEMETTFPLVRRYLKALQGRVQAWVNPIPSPIIDAFLAAGLKSAASSNTSSISPQPSEHSIALQLNVGTSSSSSPPLPTHGECKSSTSELFDTASNPGPKTGTVLAGQQFYWNPFPDHSEGMPLPLPSDNTTRAMDISSVLDSGVDPVWAQLNRDGFTIGPEDADALWAVYWGQHQPDV